MDYFLQAVFPLSSFLFSLFEQSNYLQQCYRSSDQGAEVQTFFCQFCHPLKSYRLHHTLKSSPPLPVSDLHLPSVHPHVLLRSLSLCFAFVSSLSFSFHSSLSLGGDLDPRGPCGSADGLGSTQGRRKRRKVSLVGGKRITTWMMVCARRPYCDVQICRGRWGRRVGTSARGALRGNRLIMLWVQRMFNEDVNENRRDYSGQKQSNLYPHTWNMQIPSVRFPFEFHNVNNMEERIRRKWQHQKKLSKSFHLCLKTI